MNSLLGPSRNNYSTAYNSSGSSLIYIILAISIAALVVGLVYYFFGDSVQEMWNSMFSMEWLKFPTLFSDDGAAEAAAAEAAKAAETAAAEAAADAGAVTATASSPSVSATVTVTEEPVFEDKDPLAGDASGSIVVEDANEEDESSDYTNEVAPTVDKIVPENGAPEVYNISKNTFTYNDAEPLCKALGAELATYDQVKDAWSRGADWCNYGWTQGQLAVYPTSQETYDTLQKGSAEQQLACGRPGLNGGYFDNPELRFGVNCYGPKPPQSKHDQVQAVLATPVSPETLEFDKRVAEFKAKAESIGILPFSKGRWQ